MDKIIKWILITFVVSLLIIPGFIYALVMGHISIEETPDDLLEGTNVVKSKCHCYGWTDTAYLVKMDISDGQLEAVLDKYQLKKANNFHKSKLNSFLNETPYWWRMKWSKSLEYYEAERNSSGYYAQAVVDHQKGYLLLKYFDT